MTMETDFSLDSRRQIIDQTASFDDAVVFLGLVAAGRIKSEACAEAFNKGRRIERFIGQAVSARLVPTEEWTALQQLWYRLRVPFGVASLSFWQLFCVAYGRTRQIESACDLSATWIEAIAAAPADSRVRVYSEQTGLGAARGVVAMQHDIASLDCLARAAFDGLPLIPLNSSDELAALRRDGTEVVLSDVQRDGASGSLQQLPQPSRSVASVRAFCGGRAFSVAGGSAQMREFWCELTPEDRTYVLVHLEQNISALEIVRFSYGNQVLDNEAQAALLSRCRATRPEHWTQKQLVLASLLWGWTQAGFMVHEFNQSELSLHGFRVFLERRISEYEKVTGDTLPVDLPLPELAQRFAGLRKTLEKSHQRCIYFDGGNFERREFLLKRSDMVRVRELPDALRETMAKRFGVEMPDAGPVESWKAYVGLVGEHGFTPTDLIVALAQFVADATDVPVDIAVLDVPRGVRLDKPWTFELDDIFCVTAFRTGWQPKEAKLPLDFVGVGNAIGMRMRYNALKKAQNYALVKSTTPQSFLLPDIAVGEDANHSGHNAAGIRHAARVPMSVHYQGSEWKGIADIRLSRTDYSYANRFREEDLLLASRYGIWCKAIADEAYARGILFDQRYCVNLSDGRDVEGRLGRAAKRGRA